MLSHVKLTILSENRVVNPNLIAEQGLSIFVETPNGNILFDTGQTRAFLHNAQHLKIDLRQTDKITFSHGHYDHTGGLPHFLQEVKPVEIICHPALIHKKYRVYPEGRTNIGVPWEKKEMQSLGAKFIFKTHSFEIFPDIWISGEIPRNSKYEYIDETYQQRVSVSYIHDEIHDDMCLVINTAHGLIVLLGCGHAGPINSIKHAMRLTKTKHIFAVMGGMHLHHAPEEKIKKIMRNLELLKPDFLVPLHCTGFRMINLMFTLFKKQVKLLNVGETFEMHI
ncbi:MAG: MBL fold metallo-hydrolase [Calditrichia bacterium]|nr:MBL fold metallo-hydrolase [Calditrichia bacterium]